MRNASSEEVSDRPRSLEQRWILRKKVVDAADALRVPWLVLGQWPKEHLVAAEGVRPVAFDQVIWRLDVVLGLGHFLDFVAAGVGAVVVEDELRRQILDATP